MESQVHGFVCGGLWTMFHGLSDFASSSSPRGNLDANPDKTCQLHVWRGLWMRVKGLHDYTVTVFDSCVKLP